MRVTEPYTIFPRTLKSGKIVYYYQYRDDSGRRSGAHSTGCTSQSAAKRFCQKLYNEGKMKSVSIKFSSFVDGFFDEDSDFVKWKRLSGEDITENTLTRYKQHLKVQILPYFENLTIGEISTATIKAWILWMSSRWSVKTGNNAQSVLNLILGAALEKNLIPSVPSKNLAFRKVSKKPRELLTIEEIRLISKSILWTKKNRLYALLLCSMTGLRIGECVGLLHADIKDGYLDISHAYSDKSGKIGHTKTKVSRYVPIPKGFKFPEPQEGNPWVFWDEKTPDHPVKGHDVYKTFILVCESNGINTAERGITLHTLRNFFISYLQSQNVPEPKIRAVVGHADETMTDVYTYWKPDMFPEVYEAQEKLYKLIMEEN